MKKIFMLILLFMAMGKVFCITNGDNSPVPAEEQTEQKTAEEQKEEAKEAAEPTEKTADEQPA